MKTCAIILSLTLMLAGCGGGGDSNDSVTMKPSTGALPRQVQQ